jgi:hypothetical protein
VEKQRQKFLQKRKDIADGFGSGDAEKSADIAPERTPRSLRLPHREAQKFMHCRCRV